MGRGQIKDARIPTGSRKLAKSRIHPTFGQEECVEGGCNVTHGTIPEILECQGHSYNLVRRRSSSRQVQWLKVQEIHSVDHGLLNFHCVFLWFPLPKPTPHDRPLAKLNVVASTEGQRRLWQAGVEVSSHVIG